MITQEGATTATTVSLELSQDDVAVLQAMIKICWEAGAVRSPQDAAKLSAIASRLSGLIALRKIEG